jgi:hypothetical protein
MPRSAVFADQFLRGETLGRPQISVVKRQREQAKRERQQIKDAKRAQRKNEKALGINTSPEPEEMSVLTGPQPPEES